MNGIKKYLNEDGVLYYTQKVKAALDTLLAAKADASAVADLENILRGLIEAEETARANAIATEASERSQADSNLSSDIQTISDNLASEVTAREDSDSHFQSGIENLHETKADKTELPVNVSELVNDRRYQTESEVTNAIATAISGVTQIRYEIVQELPETGENGVIYLVKYAETPQGNIYQEWIWLATAGRYETLGSTNQIDLTNYVTFDDIASITNSEIEDVFNGVFHITATSTISFLDESDNEVSVDVYRPGAEEEEEDILIAEGVSSADITGILGRTVSYFAEADGYSRANFDVTFGTDGTVTMYADNESEG